MINVTLQKGEEPGLGLHSTLLTDSAETPELREKEETFFKNTGNVTFQKTFKKIIIVLTWDKIARLT